MAFDLLTTVETGGCSSKIPPRQLEELLAGLPLSVDPKILVDIATHDDAGVYKISDDMALVLTTDFFPPLVSDGFEFGEIAAANSISDVYAMGGTPFLALNIIMFPSSGIPLEVYSEILRGGYAKAKEAGVSILGGHSIDDYPPKYGLAVIGTVHPEKVITNAGAKEGDQLILTKPIGTGIILDEHRLGMATTEQLEEVKVHMKRLNNDGARLMQKYGVTGATDITGFGLAGHALKMARGSGVTIRLNMKSVPLASGTYGFADLACIPGAAFRNLDYVERETLFEDALDYNLKMSAHDAQTSGGLLISVAEKNAEALLADLRQAGHSEAAVIGTVGARGDKPLIIG
ncbi:MAG: selenide, water dikinase SelD [Bacteroidales bacterium]|nr:selenide, water dikinase SelD [Bacteroidales bacterium]